MSYSGSEGKQMVTWARVRCRDGENGWGIQEVFRGRTYMV